MENILKPLADDEIAVWKVEIPKHLSQEKELFSLLSSSEQERARRFISPILTSRYTISQAALRLVLAQYAKQKPDKISFSYGPYKKPYLQDNPLQIQFNVTHSNDFALIAISEGHEVGIDIEKLNPKTLQSNIAHSILSTDELNKFMAIPGEVKLEAFFAAWTHKESLLKLIGTGLYKEMKELNVPLRPIEEPCAVFLEGSRIFLQSFYVTSDYLASVASPKSIFKLSFFSF